MLAFHKGYSLILDIVLLSFEDKSKTRGGEGEVGGRGHRKVPRVLAKNFTKNLWHLHEKASWVHFFLYILSSFYFIRCIQNDLFRAFYCKTFLLFYFFLKKNKQKSNKKHHIIYCLWSWCECMFIRIFVVNSDRVVHRY